MLSVEVIIRQGKILGPMVIIQELLAVLSGIMLRVGLIIV